MRIKVLFTFTLLSVPMTGRAPGTPELRNPDAPHGTLRAQTPAKRVIA